MSSIKQLTPLIEISNVSKVFPGGPGGFKALDEITLHLPAGELIAIVGKSGSGKSTLLHLMAGIDRPSRGEIRIDGTAVHALSESELAVWRGRQVGLVFQSFQLLPTLSVLENVQLPMDLCGTLAPRAARERAMDLLEQMAIADQADKMPFNLSGGQQQRAAIARALANDPALILADEPTGNLDSKIAADVLRLLAGLSDAGKTVVLVTHERDLTSFAHRIVTLADGRVADQEQVQRRALSSARAVG